MKHQFKKDVLIALMNNRSDFRIAQEDRWYRIPVKSAPENVRDGSIRYLAFYHTKIFGDQAFSVRWYGEVHRITVARRRELFPGLQGDPKAEREYLDFALFCRERNIDVECDGDEFHSKIEDVKRDKKRNNLLESLGWAVLRFTTDDIRHNLREVITQTKATVNRYGGLQYADEPGVFRPLAAVPSQ